MKEYIKPDDMVVNMGFDSYEPHLVRGSVHSDYAQFITREYQPINFFQDSNGLLDYEDNSRLSSGAHLNKALSFYLKNYEDDYGIDVLEQFYKVRDYEKYFGKSTEKLFNEWKNGDIDRLDEKHSDWLTNYLQIKDFVNV